jgi:2-polyprenyl-3-methyl-5-hydroxy-6-metoxy-1,4-benzoquinol methylase
MTADHPDIAAQTDYWNDWNSSHRFTHERSPLNDRQVETALELCLELGLRDAKIFEIGCGTGWLVSKLAGFGSVAGIDLSPAAIEWGRRQFPHAELEHGDISSSRHTGPYDLVITSEVLPHVVDQRAFIARIASLIRPGGTLLLISQNGFVWRRSSYLLPQQKGQIRNWPSLAQIRVLLSRDFEIRRVSSIDPGGDRGILLPTRVLMNGRVRRGLPHLYRLAARALEHVMVGRDMIVVARRR